MCFHVKNLVITPSGITPTQILERHQVSNLKHSYENQGLDSVVRHDGLPLLLHGRLLCLSYNRRLREGGVESKRKREGGG